MQEPLNISFEVPMLNSIILLSEVKSPASPEGIITENSLSYLQNIQNIFKIF